MQLSRLLLAVLDISSLIHLCQYARWQSKVGRSVLARQIYKYGVFVSSCFEWDVRGEEYVSGSAFIRDRLTTKSPIRQSHRGGALRHQAVT